MPWDSLAAILVWLSHERQISGAAPDRTARAPWPVTAAWAGPGRAGTHIVAVAIIRNITARSCRLFIARPPGSTDPQAAGPPCSPWPAAIPGPGQAPAAPATIRRIVV